MPTNVNKNTATNKNDIEINIDLGDKVKRRRKKKSQPKSAEPALATPPTPYLPAQPQAWGISAYAPRPVTYAPSSQMIQPEGGMPMPHYFNRQQTNTEATLNNMREAFQNDLEDLKNEMRAFAFRDEHLGQIEKVARSAQVEFERGLSPYASSAVSNPYNSPSASSMDASGVGLYNPFASSEHSAPMEFSHASSVLNNPVDGELPSPHASSRGSLHNPVGSGGLNNPVFSDAHNNPIFSDAQDHPVFSQAHNNPIFSEALNHAVQQEPEGPPRMTEAAAIIQSILDNLPPFTHNPNPVAPVNPQDIASTSGANQAREQRANLQSLIDAGVHSPDEPLKRDKILALQKAYNDMKGYTFYKARYQNTVSSHLRQLADRHGIPAKTIPSMIKHLLDKAKD